MSKKLAALAAKRRARRATPEEVFDSMIFGSIHATMSAMGGHSVSVDLGYGLVVEVEIPEGGNVGWAKHLEEIRCLVESLSVENEVDAARKIMAAEGWVWSPVALLTPAWMIPHAEIPYAHVDSLGFDWALKEEEEDG
jgi:hypothetical protein